MAGRDADRVVTRVWRCFGRAVGLRAPASLQREFGRLVPPSLWHRAKSSIPERLWEATRTGPSLYITSEGSPIGTWAELAEAARAVRSDMEIWLGANARRRVLVHASVVAVGNAALILPGPSMAGKTTLAVALVRQGADYLSDEFAVLDTQGFVHPYPRPVSIRDEQGVHRPADVDLRDRAYVGDDGLRVGMIAELAFDRTCDVLSMREISPTEAVLALLRNAVGARTQGKQVLESTVAAAQGARSFSGIRGEAAVAATSLLELMRSSEPIPIGVR